MVRPSVFHFTFSLLSGTFHTSRCQCRPRPGVTCRQQTPWCRRNSVSVTAFTDHSWKACARVCITSYWDVENSSTSSHTGGCFVCCYQCVHRTLMFQTYVFFIDLIHSVQWRYQWRQSEVPWMQKFRFLGADKKRCYHLELDSCITDSYSAYFEWFFMSNILRLNRCE